MNFDSVTIGVNTGNVKNYLETIKSDVIEEARKVLKNQQDELFAVFRANWKGQAEQRFEANMEAARQAVRDSLLAHYDALASKIVSINNSWIKQDEEMVTEYKGDSSPFGGLY